MNVLKNLVLSREKDLYGEQETDQYAAGEEFRSWYEQQHAEDIQYLMRNGVNESSNMISDNIKQILSERKQVASDNRIKIKTTQVNISSINRDTSIYANANSYTVNMPKIFENVKKIKVISTEYSNNQKLINRISLTDRNNNLYWSVSFTYNDVEVKDYPFHIAIRPGNYTYSELEEELEEKMNRIGSNIDFAGLPSNTVILYRVNIDNQDNSVKIGAYIGGYVSLVISSSNDYVTPRKIDYPGELFFNDKTDMELYEIFKLDSSKFDYPIGIIENEPIFYDETIDKFILNQYDSLPIDNSDTYPNSGLNNEPMGIIARRCDIELKFGSYDNTIAPVLGYPETDTGYVKISTNTIAGKTATFTYMIVGNNVYNSVTPTLYFYYDSLPSDEDRLKDGDVIYSNEQRVTFQWTNGVPTTTTSAIDLNNYFEGSVVQSVDEAEAYEVATNITSLTAADRTANGGWSTIEYDAVKANILDDNTRLVKINYGENIADYLIMIKCIEGFTISTRSVSSPYDLTTDEYVFACSPQLGLSTGKEGGEELFPTKYNRNAFMKLQFPSDTSVVYNYFTAPSIIYDVPLKKLDFIEIEHRDKNGELINFNDAEHSFTIEIIEFLYIPFNCNYSSRRGVIDESI